MATGEIVRCLVELADAMRVEGLAKLTYVGNRFEIEAADRIKDRENKRAAFEKALSSYVEKLVRA